ncbi:MAG: GrpB family protein [Coriobacteriales bacterium]
MPTPLEDMSLEELWELFPIVLTEHQDCWARWYEEEASELEDILVPEPPCAIHHIGSTAIDGIWAKPTIDILVELPDEAALEAAKAKLVAHGYIAMAERDLNKGYTPQCYAERVFHIHLRIVGDHDELYFRDYLNAHPEVAKEYEALKLALWKEYEHDRDGYTAAKGDFVRKYTELAKAQRPNAS